MHSCVRTVLLPAIAASALGWANAEAADFSRLVVFGDSLSDHGNVYSLTQGYPGNTNLPFPPEPLYIGGRQSNGPVAVEYLRQRLGVPMSNFAQVGATTGLTNIWDDGSLGEPAGALGLSGMQRQVETYVAQPGPADPNALYVLWGGPNDFVAGLSNPIGFNVAEAIENAVTNLSGQVALLYGEGARHFLVPGMPDIGISPRALNLGVGALASGLSVLFNDSLDAALNGLRTNLAGATIHGYPSFTFSHELRAQFSPGDLSAPEVASACLSVVACASDPTVWPTYLFWDELHPTTRAHELIGAAMAAAVPEPEAWALMLIGLGLVGWRLSARCALR